MKKTILFLFLTIGFTVFGQARKLKKADEYYTKLSYSYAVPLYQELIGSKVDNAKLKSKLATCYYKLGDMQNAEKYYAEMVNSSDATKEDLFNYAQTLKQNGKYPESDQWMQKFASVAPEDSRAISFSKNTSYVQKIEKAGEHFTIKNLANNTPSSDFGGYLNPVGKNVYFVSSRKKRIMVQNEWSWNSRRFLDLYLAQQADDKELKNEKRLKRKINTRYHEGPMCFSPDGKTVYFTRNNVAKGKQKRDKNGIQHLQLFKGEIAGDGKWINEKPLPFNSKEYSVGHPTLSADGKTLYFVSDMPGGFGGADIYKVVLNADGTYGIPENMGKQVNTEGQEMFPWITSDGFLFFSSNGHIGLGGLDVFVLLPNKKGGFGKMINVGKPINGKNDDFAFTMSNDNQTGYFASNREGGKGEDDIYSFHLTKPFKLQTLVEGIVTEKNSKEIIPGALLTLKDSLGNTLATATSDEKGFYSFEVEPENNYTLEASKEKYFPNNFKFSTINLDPSIEKMEQNSIIEKDPGLSLFTLITDKKAGTPLEGVKMTIVDNMTGKSIEYITTANGEYFRPIFDKKISDRGSYQFVLEKQGYFTKTITYNTQFKKEGRYSIHELLDFGMDKEVKDLSELVQINPIKFDLGKFNIRPDAAVELDKIVEIMNKYPMMVVELGAHTDCRGSKANNAKLSDKRAKASASYIKARISKPERIFGKGYGESRLLNGCACEGAVKPTCSEEEHAKNRRTEFKVISTGDNKVKVNNTGPDSFDKH